MKISYYLVVGCLVHVLSGCSEGCRKESVSVSPTEPGEGNSAKSMNFNPQKMGLLQQYVILPVYLVSHGPAARESVCKEILLSENVLSIIPGLFDRINLRLDPSVYHVVVKKESLANEMKRILPIVGKYRDQP